MSILCGNPGDSLEKTCQDLLAEVEEMRDVIRPPKKIIVSHHPATVDFCKEQIYMKSPSELSLPHNWMGRDIAAEVESRANIREIIQDAEEEIAQIQAMIYNLEEIIRERRSNEERKMGY